VLKQIDNIKIGFCVFCQENPINNIIIRRQSPSVFLITDSEKISIHVDFTNLALSCYLLRYDPDIPPRDIKRFVNPFRSRMLFPRLEPLPNCISE
jgi:hypothetical protein